MIAINKCFILFVIAAIWQSPAFAQKRLTDEELNKSNALKIRFEAPPLCADIDNWVKADINKNCIFLFLQGGEAPVVYPGDTTFERKYNVYFYDFGCIGFADNKCVVKYNTEVFDYLTEKYGRQWIHKIRKDIIGFREWKKLH